MDEEQRQWVRADASLVDEVEIDPVERRLELIERVQLCLLSPPVEAVEPTLGEAPHEREVRPVLPSGLRDLVGPTGALQPLPQVVQHVVVDIETVRLRLEGNHLRTDLELRNRPPPARRRRRPPPRLASPGRSRSCLGAG